MNRRVLAVTLFIAAALCALGYFVVDRALAEWVRASGIENAVVFVYGLGALDWISGMVVSIWLIGGIAFALGAIGWALRRAARWPRVLLAAALVQYATIATMIAGKDHFGRLRPQQVFAAGDWSHVWFAGGVSFPSGHSAFYFGLLLPLAAACPQRWLRTLLLAIPLFAVLARIDLAKHFLSDVSMSACLAAIYALIVASLLRHWLPLPRTASL
ncbi:MAG: phosphatase PAP2 family protein [Dokdonella sp.]